MKTLFIFIGNSSFSVSHSRDSRSSYTHHLIPEEISKNHPTVFIGGECISKISYKFTNLNIFHPFGFKSLKKFIFFDVLYFYQIKFHLWKLIKLHSVDKLVCTTYCSFIKRKFRLLQNEKYIIQFDDEFLDPLNNLAKLYDGQMCVNYSYFHLLKKIPKSKPTFHSPVLLSNVFHKTINTKIIRPKKTLNFCVIGNIDFQKFDLRILKCIANEFVDSKISLYGTVIGGTNKFLLSNLVSDHENITYHGEYIHNDTPTILSNYEFGLVPFVMNSRTMGAWPTKILEYLACGLHVFTPDLGFEKPIRKYLYFFDTVNDIKDKIRILRSQSEPRSSSELQKVLNTYKAEHRTIDFLTYANSL
jgi:hypothetical protein